MSFVAGTWHWGWQGASGVVQNIKKAALACNHGLGRSAGFKFMQPHQASATQAVHQRTKTSAFRTSEMSSTLLHAWQSKLAGHTASSRAGRSLVTSGNCLSFSCSALAPRRQVCPKQPSLWLLAKLCHTGHDVFPLTCTQPFPWPWPGVGKTVIGSWRTHFQSRCSTVSSSVSSTLRFPMATLALMWASVRLAASSGFNSPPGIISNTHLRN